MMIPGIALAWCITGAPGDVASWVSIPKPPNITVAPNARGTTAMFLTSSAVHLFSGITKVWTALPASSVSFAEQYHSHAIVLDGGQLHGFGSRQGVVDTIAVSPAVQLFNGPINSCWVTFALDGSTLHAFSGFRGEWVALQLQSQSPAIAVTGTVGLVRDGATVYGFSAHYGDFVPVTADAQASLEVATEVATAHSPGVFRAFSPQQNRWGVASFPTTGVQVLRPAFALTATATGALAFSGLSGVLAQFTSAAPLGPIEFDTAVAVFAAGNDVVCYGAGPSAFSVLAGAAGAQFALDGDFALLSTTEGVTPFSAVTGAFGAMLPGAYTIFTNETIGFVDGASDFAYSPLTNQWIAAPSVTPIAGPILLRSCVVLPTPFSYEALSARYGEWVSQPVTTPLVYDAKPDGSTFLAIDGSSTAHVFDARIGRFETITGAGTLSTATFRNTTIAWDGATAWGFGQPAGKLESIALDGAVTKLTIKTSIAILETASSISVFSAKGSFSQESRYPEFFLSIQLGNSLRLRQIGPAGAGVLTFIAAGPGYTPVGAQAGVFFLDPASLLPVSLANTIPPSGNLELVLPLPQLPALVGIQPHLQNAILPPNGPAYLTTSVAPVPY